MNAVYLVSMWLHFVALAAAGAASFGIPVVGMVARTAAPDIRPVLTGLIGRLSRVGHVALGVLIVTGAIMLWLGAGEGGLSGWFWVKMGLVAVLIVAIAFSVRVVRRLEAGDAAAEVQAARMGAVNQGLFVLIMLMAVLSFG
jgi:uncharacterized membrane protein